MNRLALWLILLAIGVITYAIRLSFILLLGKIEMPPFLLRALRFVPISVLSAIILPALLLSGNSLNVSLTNVRLLAGILAIGVAWKTKSALLTIVVGMVGLWILQAVVR